MIAGVTPATAGILVAVMLLAAAVVCAWWDLRSRRRERMPPDTVGTPPASADPPMRGDIWRAWMEEHWQGKDPQRRA